MGPKTLSFEEAQKIKEEETEKLEKQSSDKDLEDPEKEVLKVESVFPFQLFPDQLFVYPNHVRKISRMGPGMERVLEFNIHDIDRVEVGTAPFFAQLTIVSNKPGGDPIVMERLSRADAIKVHQVIEQMMDKVSQS